MTAFVVLREDMEDNKSRVKYSAQAKREIKPYSKGYLQRLEDLQYKSIYDQIRERQDNLCAYCDGDKRLGIHHIDKNHSNMHKDNLVLLCWDCHTNKTNGIYSDTMKSVIKETRELLLNESTED